MILPVTEDIRPQFGFTVGAVPDEGRRPRHGTLFELCELGEELGFDFVTVPHHRFTPDHYAPSAPLMVLAALAARTSKLRLSSSIYLMPTYHALEVAEQIATLDQLSDGRATLTFGAGYRSYEFEHLGLSLSSRGSRMEEGLEVLHQSWSDHAVHFHGRHYDIDGAQVTPKPVQKPYPPIWIGAQAKVGIDRTARLAEGWMADYMQPLPVLRRRAGFYRQCAVDIGRPAEVCLMRQVAIASSRRQIEEEWLPTARASFLSYWNAGGRWPGGEDTARRLMAGEDVPLNEFVRDRDVAGDPEDCIRQIEHFHREVPFEHFLATFGNTRSPEQTKQAMELFAREVMPAFR